MAEHTTRRQFGDYLSWAETAVYSILAVLLCITAVVAIAGAGKQLWDGLNHGTLGLETIGVLNQLLLVLMMVEILHTVRISIRSHFLVTEPFLVIGLIASIRRMLVISLEMATLSKDGYWVADGASLFRASLRELGLLGILVLVLVFSITLLRRYAPNTKEV
jgi:hypothetical protein